MKPLTRKEAYLARMAGEDVQLPEPLTREEAYMKGIAAQIEAGAAELPAVTDADEGKILAVNANGKWDKAASKTPLEVYAAEGNTINWNDSYIENGVAHLHFSVTGTWIETGAGVYITANEEGKTLPAHKHLQSGATFGAWAIKNSNGKYFMVPFIVAQLGLVLSVGLNTEMTAATYIISGEYPIAE